MTDKTPKINEYKVKKRRGIDDLEGQLGDFTTEWWTIEDWNKYNDAKPARDKRNQERIDKLKTEGTYGEEYNINISIISNPLFDDVIAKRDFKESYRFITLNLKDEEE